MLTKKASEFSEARLFIIEPIARASNRQQAIKSKSLALFMLFAI